LIDLAAHEGELVRVGGLVVSLDQRRVLVDDGTARATIFLPAQGSPVLAGVRPGQAVNAVGVATRWSGDQWAVVLRVGTDIALVAALGPGGSPGTDPGLMEPGSSSGALTAAVPADSGFTTLLVGALGLMCAGTALLGLAIRSVMVRRRRDRESAGRIADRLDGLQPVEDAGPSPVADLGLADTTGSGPAALGRPSPALHVLADHPASRRTANPFP